MSTVDRRGSIHDTNNGQFTGHIRTESDPNVLSGQTDRFEFLDDGHPLQVAVLPSVPDEWFTDENRQTIRQIRDTGRLTGELTVFQFTKDRLGEWKAAMPIADTGNYLTFTKHRGSVLVVEAQAHPTNAAFGPVSAVEGRDGELHELIDQVLQADRVLTQVQRRFPYVRSGFGRRVGQPPQLEFWLPDGDPVVLQLQEPNQHGRVKWETTDGIASWIRLANVTGEHPNHVSLRLAHIAQSLETDSLQHRKAQ